MSQPAGPRASVAVLHSRQGFPAAGGITTLMQLLVGELHRRGQLTQLAQGWWPRLPGQVVVLGCGSPWAYLQLLRQRLLRPAARLIWVPCFHPPAHVRHKTKATLARWALRLAQRAGIEVRVLSAQEHRQLNAGRCQTISLGFERRLTVDAPQPNQHRPFDLVFLGRPTVQKGWPLFEDLVRRTGLNSLALLAHPPEQLPAAEITVITAGRDATVHNGLARSKLLLLPADYESFGFAQAEALAMGCCVPVLGEWPLWLDVPELDWRGLDASAIAARLQDLLGAAEHWRRLQQRQQRAWQLRPERLNPAWP